MSLHDRFYDGSQRPAWAGPVMAESRRHRLRYGRYVRGVHVSGIVLPVHVHPRYPPVPGHGHTSGLGLGFPDLSEFLLDPSRFGGQLSRQWSSIERAIGQSASRLMGLSGQQMPRDFRGARPPMHALELTLEGELPEDERDESAVGGFRGDLNSVFPITDPSGARVRMQRGGNVSRLHVGPLSSGWSRDPRTL
jgi:hypothetical protein